jgi:hypothetical protein
MAISMGIGLLGGAGATFKRKFRWTFALNGTRVGDIPSMFVKKTARPKVTGDETRINFLNGTTFIPNKYVPDDLNVTFYDLGYNTGVGGSDGGDAAKRGIANLYGFISTLYDLANPSRMAMGGNPAGYAAQAGVLTMLDGCGNPIEIFTYNYPWPKSIDFGELDYGSNDECEINMTMRYQSFSYQAVGSCVTPPTFVNCIGC